MPNAVLPVVLLRPPTQIGDVIVRRVAVPVAALLTRFRSAIKRREHQAMDQLPVGLPIPIQHDALMSLLAGITYERFELCANRIRLPELAPVVRCLPARGAAVPLLGYALDWCAAVQADRAAVLRQHYPAVGDVVAGETSHGPH